MCGRVPFFVGVLLFLSTEGCQNCDLVEAELRTRENQLRECHGQLLHAGASNTALRQELDSLRLGAGATVSPELAAQTFTVKEIAFGPLSGGYDNDGLPGDEALVVVLEPHDLDGQAIKAPGGLRIDVFDVAPNGLMSAIAAWEVAPEQLHRTWRNGFLSTGYYLLLPWQKWPSQPKVRVVANFRLPDGRLFQADKEYGIRLPAAPLPPPVPLRVDGPALPPPPCQPVPMSPSGPAPVGPIRPASTPPTSPRVAELLRPGPGL
jgi:hypothetical protein